MHAGYVKRSIEPVLVQASAEFPAVILTGPRQSGKTTTLRHLFGATHGYVSLETPDVRMAAEADPRGFLDLHPPPVIFDEAQYAPDLLAYVKERIDARRRAPGQYILTGSQNLLLMEKVTETLAGRAAILKLLPLARREIYGTPLAEFPWEDDPIVWPTPEPSRLWDDLLRGGFPEPALDRERDLSLWHSSYLQTYLERDVRGLRQIGNITLFQSFLRTLAARSGQLLNLSDLARDLGIAVNTAKAWLSVLEATFQIIVLRPYFTNLGKRLVKRPKIYFTDPGTLCHLVGLRDPGHAAAGPMAGTLFETAVVTEVVKTFLHRGQEPAVHFWRTSSGVEVDLVVPDNDRLIPIEVKSSSTPRPPMARHLRAFRKVFGERSGPGYLIHTGDIRLPLGPGITAVPFRHL